MTPDFDDLVISTGYAPVAVNDAGATNLNTSYTFSASGPNSLTFNDTDADTPLAQLHVVAVTSPSHGSATLNATNGLVTYTPSPDFSGSDGFTYTVSDGLLVSTTTVSMNVGPVTIDSSPVASNGAITTNEDTPAIGTLSASGAHPLTYSLVANGTKGTATISNIATGAFTYAPNANANGTDTLTFKVNDGKADSNVATVTVTITAVNDAPGFTKGADQTVFANSGAHAVVAWATALSAGPPDEAAQTLSFIVSNTNNGLFSAQPAIVPNGTLTYTSAVNAVGSATVTVAIHDTGGTAICAAGANHEGRDTVFSGCTVEFLYTTDPDRVIEAVFGGLSSEVSYVRGDRTRDVENGSRHGPVRQWAFGGFQPSGLEGADISVTARLNEIRLVSTEDKACVSPMAYLEARRTTVLDPMTRQSLDLQLQRVDPVIVKLRPRFALPTR